jgi:7-cyano-7-deazaguanine synthase
MEPKRSQNGNSVCVLLSGGLDSAACVAFYLGRGLNVRALHVDYGQPAARQEETASRAIAGHYHVERFALHLKGTHPMAAGLIHGRNAFLLLVALMEFGPGVSLFATGVHAGTTYPDCSVSFIDSIQKIFDIYTDGISRVAAPFADWTKRDIWQFCIGKHVPIHLTYSCEAGGDIPCGRCLSCKDVEVIRAA